MPQIRVILPELKLFEMDPLPSTLPAPKPKPPTRKHECELCGRPIRGRGWRPGDLCSKCINREPMDPVLAAAAICCRGCPPGECAVIPW